MVPLGKKLYDADRAKHPPMISWEATWWVISTIVHCGLIERITPFMVPT